MKKSGDIHLPPHEYVNLTGQVGSRDSPPPGIHREGGGGADGKVAPLSIPLSSNGDMFRPVCVCFRVPFVSNGKSEHPFMKRNCRLFPITCCTLRFSHFMEIHCRTCAGAVRGGFAITELLPEPLPPACPTVALLPLAVVEWESWRRGVGRRLATSSEDGPR